MFTLGNKEAIVNSAGQYTSTANGAGLDIFNFGNFGTSLTGPISNIIAQYFAPETLGAGTLVCPTGTTIGLETASVRNSVTFLMRVTTSRYASEWATDFIRRGRPFVINLSINQAHNSAQVADILDAALTAYETEFVISDNKMGSLPFNWVNDGAGNITFETKAGDLSLEVKTVWQRTYDAFGLEVSMTAPDGTTDTGVDTNTGGGAITAGADFTVDDSSVLWVGQSISIGGTAAIITEVKSGTVIVLDTTITAADGTAIDWVTSTTLVAQETRVDGKYLEENVRMSIGDSTDGAYSIKPGERPVISAPYIMFSWEYTAPIGTQPGWAGHKRLGLIATDLETGTQKMKYSMYFNADVFTSDSGASQDGANLSGDALAVWTWLALNDADGDWAGGTKDTWT